jgi:hypothetical protein
MSSAAQSAPRGSSFGRARGQHRVAIALFEHMQRRMEMHLHAKLARDHMRLVDPAGAEASDIEFLKQHDVRLRICDHRGDALGRQPPIAADAAMDVVRHDPGHAADLERGARGGKSGIRAPAGRMSVIPRSTPEVSTRSR